MTTRSPLRLRQSSVTVLLGPAGPRRQVLLDLDEASATCASGHPAGVSRFVPRVHVTAADRVAAIDRLTGCTLLLAAGPTVGLDAPGRRAVLHALQALARTGAAVLVDDVDPVAALAIADTALRAGGDGTLEVVDLSALVGDRLRIG